MVMKQNIDPAVRKQIEDAISSGRINPFLCDSLDHILTEDDGSLLEQKISFFAEGNPPELPQGMIKSPKGIYTVHATYKELLKYVSLCDEKGTPSFSYFEASSKLRKY